MVGHPVVLLSGGFLDGLVGSTFFVVGGSITAISISVIGLAWWIGTVMRPSSMWTVLGRAAIGGLGVSLFGAGLSFLVLGGDATFGHPLGRLLNPLILIAWWLGSKAGFYDLLVTAASTERLAVRRDSNLLRALSRFVAALGVVLGCLAKGSGLLAAFLLFAAVVAP